MPMKRGGDNTVRLIYFRTELRRSLKTAADRTGCGNKGIWSAFWGAHQRFFKQLWYVTHSVQYFYFKCNEIVD